MIEKPYSHPGPCLAYDKVAVLGSDGSRLNFFIPGWVGSAISGFGNYPLQISNFSIFSPSGQKNSIGSGQKVPGSKTGRPLIYCGSKICMGLVGSGPHL